MMRSLEHDAMHHPLVLAGVGAVVGFFCGVIVFIFVRGLGGVAVWWVLYTFPAITGIAMWAWGGAVFRGVEELAGRLYMGGRAPPQPPLSHAESLVARARFEEAITAYAEVGERFPAHPEPLLRVARILRDDLERPEDALGWFRRARERCGGDPECEGRITFELVEVFSRRLARPAAALPELARLAARFPDHPVGRRAARELAALKAVVHRGVRRRRAPGAGLGGVETPGADPADLETPGADAAGLETPGVDVAGGETPGAGPPAGGARPPGP